MTKHSYINLKLIHDMGGVVPSSEWITGTGRDIKSKPVPPYCSKIPVKKIPWLRGVILQQAQRLIKKRPLVRYVIAITDLKKVNKILKEIYHEKTKT